MRFGYTFIKGGQTVEPAVVRSTMYPEPGEYLEIASLPVLDYKRMRRCVLTSMRRHLGTELWERKFQLPVHLQSLPRWSSAYAIHQIPRLWIQLFSDQRCIREFGKYLEIACFPFLYHKRTSRCQWTDTRRHWRSELSKQTFSFPLNRNSYEPVEQC